MYCSAMTVRPASIRCRESSDEFLLSLVEPPKKVKLACPLSAVRGPLKEARLRLDPGCASDNGQRTTDNGPLRRFRMLAPLTLRDNPRGRRVNRRPAGAT